MDLRILKKQFELVADIKQCDKLIFLNLRSGISGKQLKTLMIRRIGFNQQISSLHFEVMCRFVQNVEEKIFTTVRDPDQHNVTINAIYVRGTIVADFMRRHGRF